MSPRLLGHFPLNQCVSVQRNTKTKLNRGIPTDVKTKTQEIGLEINPTGWLCLLVRGTSQSRAQTSLMSAERCLYLDFLFKVFFEHIIMHFCLPFRFINRDCSSSATVSRF